VSSSATATRPRRPRLAKPLEESDTPIDLRAEAAVLGACLLEGRPAVQRAARIVEPAHFVDRRHQLIFAAMLSLLQDGSAIDPITVSARLRDGTRL